MAYTFAQLEQIARAGGFPAAMAPLMAAIALAESGGNATAVNPTDNYGTQSSFGLWQISNGTHTPPSSSWSDPITNAQLAYQKYQTQGLGAWGTYTSGAYQQYLSGATPSSLVTPGASGGGGSTTSLGLSFLGSDWWGNPVRVFKMIAGILLLIAGMLALFLSNDHVQNIMGGVVEGARDAGLAVAA